MDDDTYDETLAAIQAEYAASLPDRLAAVERPWSDLQKTERADERHALALAMIRAAHGIAGTAALFGRAQLGRVAGELEDLLGDIRNRGAFPSDSDFDRIGKLVLALRSAIG